MIYTEKLWILWLLLCCHSTLLSIIVMGSSSSTLKGWLIIIGVLILEWGMLICSCPFKIEMLADINDTMDKVEKIEIRQCLRVPEDCNRLAREDAEMAG